MQPYSATVKRIVKRVNVLVKEVKGLGLSALQDLEIALDAVRTKHTRTDYGLLAIDTENRAALDTFITERCLVFPIARDITFKDFYVRFVGQVTDPHNWPKNRVRAELIGRGYPLVKGSSNKTFVSKLGWRSVQ
jgi:hypothetical protein